MNRPSDIKLPPNLVLSALISSSLTIVVSITYSILCVIGLIVNSTCSIGIPDNLVGGQYLLNIAYRVYIQDGCDHSMSPENLTSANTVYVFMAVILAISLVSLVTACFLIAVVRSDDKKQYINFAVYTYIGVSVSALVLDMVFAIFFGIDYACLTTQLNQSSIGMGFNYETDTIRMGAFLLMTISLKGYVVPVFNIVLLGLISYYANEYDKALHKDQHSIHKMGAINAFDLQRRNDWMQQIEPYPPFTRSSQVNNGFFQDDDVPRTTSREPSRGENFPSRAFDRSDSWNHSRAAPDPVHGNRPFSYLDEIKRQPQLKPTPSPAIEPQWRRDKWSENPGPPLPAPDYSPQAPRRLKSALKSGYM